MSEICEGRVVIDWPALEEANRPLNAFTDFDSSATGSDGPLGGITIGVKANIAVQDMPWTAGMELYRDRVAEQDAAVVAAIRAAGGTIIGMLNMEEAALGAKTDNPWFGKSCNPHKLSHTPGGSSGGSGAAVAAGLCDAALGTDTMGSVRIPAAYCGVYGFKPAQSAISKAGLELTEESLDCIGPIARSVDLLENISRVISNVGEADAATGPLATLVETGVDCQLEVIENFRDVLRLAGGEIAAAQLPHSASRIRYAGFIKTVRSMQGYFAGADRAKLSGHLAKLLTYGSARKDTDWAADQAILAATAKAMQDIVARHKAIILPTAPQAAFAHSDDAPANQADYTCLANIAGLPAITLPSGYSDDNMPIGIQIIGQKGSEADLFALARSLDEKCNAYKKPHHYFNK